MSDKKKKIVILLQHAINVPCNHILLGEKYVKTTKNIIKFKEFSFYFFPFLRHEPTSIFFLYDMPGIPLLGSVNRRI